MRLLTLMRGWIAVLLSTVFFANPVYACGPTTHKTVVHRALETFSPLREFARYEDILQMNQGAMHAGSNFPDWLYLCGKDHGNGDYVHSDRYQPVAANYIRSLPRPWDQHTEELVAFVLGTVSHVEADRVWHELPHTPFGYGFIGSLGAPDFGCYGNLHRCSTAHQAADWGAEFLAAAHTDLMWPSYAEWAVPTKHLIGIFRAGGLTDVSAATLDTCDATFHLILELIRVFGPKVYGLLAGRYRRDGPCVGTAEWMVDNYLHHPVGGVDDMAARTQWQWERFASWLDGNHSIPSPPSRGHGHAHATLSVPGVARRSEEGYGPPEPGPSGCLKQMMEGAKEMVLARRQEQLHAQRFGRGVGNSLERLDGGLLNASVELMGRVLGLEEGEKGELMDAALAREREGRGVRGRGRGRGRGKEGGREKKRRELVEEEGGGRRQGQVAGDHPVTEDGPSFQYEGASLALGDFDKDGRLDLVVGRPGAGRGQRAQAGGFTVKYGVMAKSHRGAIEKFGRGVSNAAKGNGDGAQARGAKEDGSVGMREDVFEGEGLRGRTGWSLAVLDFNADGYDDLVVGAPSWGYGGGANTGKGEDEGEEYAEFGRISIHFGGPSGLASGGSNVTAQGNVTIQGEGTFGESLGLGLSVVEFTTPGGRDLVVKSHLCGCGGMQRGGVWVFAPSALFTHGRQLGLQDASVTLKGDYDFEWFGFSAASHVTTSHVTHLVVGSPGFKLAPNAPAVGRVQIFDVAGHVSVSIIGQEARGHFGCSVAGGRTNSSSRPMGEIAVGHCGYDVYGEPDPGPNQTPEFGPDSERVTEPHPLYQAGAIHLFDAERLLNRSGAAVWVLYDHVTIQGSMPLGRLGSALLLFDVDGDGHQEIVASAPFANLATGILTIYRLLEHEVHDEGRFTSCEIAGREERALFGRVFVAAFGGEQGDAVGFVGSPRASSGAGGMEGTVNRIVLCVPPRASGLNRVRTQKWERPELEDLARTPTNLKAQTRAAGAGARGGEVEVWR